MTTFLLDVNVLIALSLPTHQHHRDCSDWLEGGPLWATTPVTESAYVRLMTNPHLAGYPIPVEQAIKALSTMRQLDRHSFVPDSSSLCEPEIATSRLAGSQQVTDFHLVNLAATNSMMLATFDGSLARSLHPDDRQHIHVISA